MGGVGKGIQTCTTHIKKAENVFIDANLCLFAYFFCFKQIAIICGRVVISSSDRMYISLDYRRHETFLLDHPPPIDQITGRLAWQ